MVAEVMLEQTSTMVPRARTSAAAGPADGRAGFADRARVLLTPEAGLLGQTVRFVLNGCVSASVYLSSTTVLALVVGAPFELALAAGFCLMIAVNFTLHRLFVWVNREGFALTAHRQFGRYISFEVAQYGLTALGVGVLPHALGLPAEAVYLLLAVAFAGVSFLIFRHGVFHARRSA
jgi:putative flippase GtrA